MQNFQVRDAAIKDLLPLVLGLLIGIAVGSSFIADRLSPNQWAWVIAAIPLCVLLIFSIYVVRKRISDISLLWILVMLGTSLSFRQRNPNLLETSEAVDAQVLARLVIYAFCGLYVLYRGVRWPNRLLKAITTSPLKWMLFYGLLALLSTAYSSTKALTLVSSLQLMVLVTLLGVTIAIDNVSAVRIWNITLLTLVVIILAVWGLYFVDPDLAITVQWPNLRRLGGLLIHPNALGVVAAALGVVALCRWLMAHRMAGRLLYAGMLVGSVITLIETQSRAASVGWLLGSLAVLMLLRRRQLPLLLSAMVLLALSVALFLPGVVSSGIERFERGQDIMALTGRIVVWRHVLIRAGQSWQALLLGYGYGASRLSLLAQLPGNWTHTHNAFIEALMGLGIPGVFLVTMSFVSTGFFLRRGLVRSRGQARVFHIELLGVGIVLFVVSMASAAVAGRPGISLFIFLSLLACLSRMRLTGEV